VAIKSLKERERKKKKKKTTWQKGGLQMTRRPLGPQGKTKKIDLIVAQFQSGEKKNKLILFIF
jgi:hypothetical protein